jgi:hypothetical protein
MACKVKVSARGSEGVKKTCVTDTDKKIRDAADSLDNWKYLALYYCLDNSY